MATDTVYNNGVATTYDNGKVVGVKTGPGAVPAPNTNSTNGDQTGYVRNSNNQMVPGPTVVSNQTALDKIPDLNTKASALTPPVPTTLTTDPTIGATSTDTTTTPSTDYGSLYKDAFDSTPQGTDDPTYQKEMDLINSMMTHNDEVSNAAVSAVQKQYQDLSAGQQQSNSSTTAKINNALILGGGARYAPVSSQGILSLKNQSDMAAVSKLNDDENSKIAEIRQSQSNQDYQGMEKQLQELDAIRSNRQTLAKSIADEMYKTNTAQKAQQTTATKNNAIAGLVTQGTTDPSAIVAELTKQGISADAKDVASTLETIQKATGQKSLSELSGNIGAFYSLKASGALPAGVSSLPEDQQLFAFLKQYKAADTAPKSGSSAASSSGKTIKSGTLTYSPQDFAEDSALLRTGGVVDGVTYNPKGADGYVDPDLYQTLANSWISGGGNITDFLKAYPPKDYVNPVNTTLPTYLRSSTKSGTNSTSSSSTASPF